MREVEVKTRVEGSKKRRLRKTRSAKARHIDKIERNDTGTQLVVHVN